jgi:hypothetical protein
MKRFFIISIFCIVLSIPEIYPQEKKSLTLNGYLTAMPSIMFNSQSGTISNDILIHNRLNFKYFPGKYLTFALELRNRIIKGDMVGGNIEYPEMIGNDPGLVDMSWNILEKHSFLINTSIDRCWIDYNRGKFQVRVGRQRINWGQTLVWNPNDIFNAYSFFDFDYVERPGSDAVRLQYFPGSSSAIEIAVKADQDKDITTAALYRFNKWGYDIQVLAGYADDNDLVAGTGWSGSIGSVSFRGEATWFQPVENFPDTTGRGLFTVGIDKVFKDNSMVQFQVMYCNDPPDFTDFNSFYSGNMSAKDLAFSRFTAFTQFSYSATPLLNLTISAMWFPDLNGYFAGPSMDYSLAENIDFSLIWQNFESRLSGIRTRINLGFIRLKFSF